MKTITAKCPSCGSKNILSILYGKPTKEMMRRAARGEVKLGGCNLSIDNPNRYCGMCGGCWLDKTDQNWIAGERLRQKLRQYQDGRRKAK